jgi:hypothetical protein
MIRRLFSILKTLKFSDLIYPLFLVFQIPFAWISTLWQSKILLYGQWSRFMGYNPKNALNSLFYRTQYINIDTYGKNGISPHLGLGNFEIRRWFHLSLISSYIYAHAGAVTTLLGALFWASSHLIWIQQRNVQSVIMMTIVLIFSSTTYSFAFSRQNYQILSWMWFPVALYSMLYTNWAVASFAWLISAMFGITPVFFAVIIALFITIDTQTIPPILSVIPATIFIIIEIVLLLRQPNGVTNLNNTAKLIGLTRSRVKYHRFDTFNDLTTVYYIIIYVSATFMLWYLDMSVPKLAFVGLALFIVNQVIFRVADIQSVNLLFISLFICSIHYEANYWSSIVLLWLISSVHPLVLGIMNNASKQVQTYAPFSHYILENQVKDFLKTVPTGNRILFAFNDPKNRYDNIFDLYRVLIELPLYIASKRAIHLFPDWYAVMDTNYEGAPSIWGRSVDEVLANTRAWNAQYVIVYEPVDKHLDPRWNDAFELVSTFSWQPYTSLLRDYSIIPDYVDIPVWYLLKCR